MTRRVRDALIARPRALFGAAMLVASLGATAEGAVSDVFGSAYVSEATQCLAGAIADGANDGRRCVGTLAAPCREPARDAALWASEARCLEVLASAWGYEARRHATDLDRMRQPGTSWSLFALYTRRWRQAETLCNEADRGFGIPLDGPVARHLCTLIARGTLAHILEFHPKRLIDTTEEPT